MLRQVIWLFFACFIRSKEIIKRVRIIFAGHNHKFIIIFKRRNRNALMKLDFSLFILKKQI